MSQSAEVEDGRSPDSPLDASTLKRFFDAHIINPCPLCGGREWTPLGETDRYAQITTGIFKEGMDFSGGIHVILLHCATCHNVQSFIRRAVVKWLADHPAGQRTMPAEIEKLDDYIQLDRRRSGRQPLPSSSGGGTSGGGMDRLDKLEMQMDAVEGRLESIDSKLDGLIASVTDLRVVIAAGTEKLNGLSGRVDTLPTGKEFGELKGAVDRLPSVATLSILLAATVALFTLLPKLQALVASYWP